MMVVDRHCVQREIVPVCLLQLGSLFHFLHHFGTFVVRLYDHGAGVSLKVATVHSNGSQIFWRVDAVFLAEPVMNALSQLWFGFPQFFGQF